MERTIGNKKMDLLEQMCHPRMFERIPTDTLTSFMIYHSKDVDPDDGRRYTAVTLKVDNKDYTGYAKCSSSDNFCRRTGRELALKRAVRLYWDDIKENINQD